MVIILKGLFMQSPTPQRRWLVALAVVSTLGFGSGLALSQGAERHHGADGVRHAPSPEQMARGVEHRIDGIIKAVDGTPAQKTQLLQLSQAALADMKPLHEQQMAGRKQGLQLLAATVVDRRALEALRVQQIALADAMSKRRVQHLADAAEVLTPAQRSKLAERMQKLGGVGHGGRPDGMGFGGGFGR
jgi:periplasmic protein CpxP/Spy